ncbi:hypothetical protein J3E69DRAFT_319672 [Trichoderma sp. SZMC 28015]
MTNYSWTNHGGPDVFFGGGAEQPLRVTLSAPTRSPSSLPTTTRRLLVSFARVSCPSGWTATTAPKHRTNQSLWTDPSWYWVLITWDPFQQLDLESDIYSWW